VVLFKLGWRVVLTGYPICPQKTTGSLKVIHRWTVPLNSLKMMAAKFTKSSIMVAGEAAVFELHGQTRVPMEQCPASSHLDFHVN